MKKLIAIGLTALFAVNSYTILAAEDLTYEELGVEYTYEKIENEIVIKGFNILGRVEDNIIVPDEIDGAPVTTLGERAFCTQVKVEHIQLPNTLKNIGKEAMYGLRYLKSVELPESLEYIGTGAFLNTPIAEITIPENVEEIANYAFSSTGIEKVTFLGKPKLGRDQPVFDGSLKYVEGLPIEEISKNWLAFKWTEFGKKYTTDDPEKALIINDGVLEGYIGTDTEVVIPEGVTEIYSSTFKDKPITKVTLPNTLKKIEAGAFENTKIKEITIPASVEEVDMAFKGCRYLQRVVFEPSDHDVKISDVAFKWMDLDELVLPENISTIPSMIVEDLDETASPVPSSTPKPETTPEPTAIPTASPIPQTLTVEGGEEIKVNVGGEVVAFPDAKPFIDENDRTQVPVRAVAEMLDCKVDWNGETQTVTITKNGEVITFVIGEDVMSKNNEKVQMDTKAMIKDERTYIPVRFAAEALGLEVEYK